ncbi:DUF2790 domain-containing protein [Pseudomonas panipatensis]|jgi:hypothetical protein|uniref:DUF2790 domain-containing protein n=1 Tax=Pseudomonas panipatensis TaxID=428992 RepID=A0A1G8CYE1_9PSED|nr:DUF2790 domain-containing protein [Pseudomonas panipatensis]SDH50521.1 Protein of unknown function [Pseudomonas panipatensis]SMP63120.1 Protein of unknown function [Pseudomonas panipatensis]
MNGRGLPLLLWLLPLLACPAAFAEPGDPPAEDYHYGMRLDIAKVLRQPDLDFCGIREVEMLYLDHQGKRHLLRYPVWGQGCQNEG